MKPHMTAMRVQQCPLDCRLRKVSVSGGCDLPTIGRRCSRCRIPLASDNLSAHCAGCQHVLARLMEGPPELPGSFWDYAPLRHALSDRHMGRVVAAYRSHPYHGRPIPQELVGSWAHMSQAQVSRLETGRPEGHLERLVFWANLLGIPQQLLWFETSASSISSPRIAERRAQHPEAGVPAGALCNFRLVSTTAAFYGDSAKSVEVAAAEEVDAVRRRTIIRALGAMTALSTPSIDLNDAPRVNQLESGCQALRRLYHNSSAPEDLRELAESYLATTALALRASTTTADRNRVLAARSEIAILAGRLSFFDLHRDVEARGYYNLGYEAASQCGDQGLAAAALGHLAFVPARENNMAAAMDYLQGATHHAAQTEVRLLESWVAAVESELTARAAPDFSMSALERANELLAKPSSGLAPDWFDYYSEGRLTGFTGFVLLRQGHAVEARAVLNAALTSLESSAIKQRAVFLADIASSYIADSKHADVEQACATATQSVTMLTQAGYAVGAERLRALRQQLRPWQDQATVRELDERLEPLFQ
jgi:hypothetical protein